ncbi:MAG: hypothetical protein ACD_2C00140G0002 [uncultured bacterium (gcode 4)]|uniref:Uncharacterized protein n=1 Tax=uncultured bacterium (gcode 4) TaxID=1234023 RepID=K2G5R1_9BACT|nr:MAG: hypothetical protein ACD_2C00140G0002 [uncultured bacterium (gcode 4)]
MLTDFQLNKLVFAHHCSRLKALSKALLRLATSVAVISSQFLSVTTSSPPPTFSSSLYQTGRLYHTVLSTVTHVYQAILSEATTNDESGTRTSTDVIATHQLIASWIGV